jgi:fructose-bisphosphate aldolase class II
MALVTMREILPEARKQKRAVGGFNIANYETARAVVMAAEQEKSPVVIQLYMRMFHSEKACDLAGALLRMIKRANQPIALHLDHGESIGQVRNAISWGYTSVMFDGSNLPFDENIKRTKQAADYAGANGASCEGEIGHVAMGDETALTEPDEAYEFAVATGVDALAVSIGTAHGYYKSEPRLDIERCRAIAGRLPDVPLVLHGGSGTPPAEVRKVIQCGVAKINVATEFQDTFLKATRAKLNGLDGKFVPIDKFMDPVTDECAAHVSRLIRFFADK